MSALDVMIGMAYFCIDVSDEYKDGIITWTGVGMEYFESLTFSSMTE